MRVEMMRVEVMRVDSSLLSSLCSFEGSSGSLQCM